MRYYKLAQKNVQVPWGQKRRENLLTQRGEVEGGIRRQSRARLPEAVKNIKENRILKRNYLLVK